VTAVSIAALFLPRLLINFCSMFTAVYVSQRASDDQISNGNVMETDPNADVKKVNYLMLVTEPFQIN